MTDSRAPRRERILVVDDSPPNRDVAEGHLTGAGYEVIQAEDGEEALLLFQAHQPDLVLLDILMPNMDGFVTCRRLRELPSGKETPIVFLTAFSDKDTHERALYAGGDDFLSKPITRTELLIRVRSLLRIRRFAREIAQANDVIKKQLEDLVEERKRTQELVDLIVRDVKSYLLAIPTNIQVAQSDEGLSDDSRECLRDVLRATSTVHRMVMNLVDVAQGDGHRIEPVLDDVSIGTLVVSVVDEMRDRADVKGQSIETLMLVGDVVIRADPELLARVLENLVDDAVKHAPHGSGIVLTARAVDDSVEIRVLDEGPPVPEDWREAILDGGGTDPADEGAPARSSRDVSLAFCRLAVAAHGGTITIEEAEGGGNAYCVRLPLGVV